MMNDDTVMLEEDVLTTEESTELPLPEIAEDSLPEPTFEEDKPEESEENKIEEEKEDIEVLKRELETLKSELEENRKSFERMSREIGEFSEVFPEKSVNQIPDSVWESVRAGIPLAAAYALYERKNAVRADAACRINERNGNISTGSVGRASTENFYTPDEVRAMSQSEVRKNYSKILESMKKWN